MYFLFLSIMIFIFIIFIFLFIAHSFNFKKWEKIYYIPLKNLDSRWNDLSLNETLNPNEKLKKMEDLYKEYQLILKECDNYIDKKK